MPQFIYTALNFPAFQFFNNGVQRFVDGCSSDVTGILALLRTCTNIVAGIVCDASVNDPVDARDYHKSFFGHYAGLFGVQTSEYAGESTQNVINTIIFFLTEDIICLSFTQGSLWYIV